MIELKPVYDKMSFTNGHEFGEWLLKTTSKQILLNELGQEVTKLWVADSGEVLHADSDSCSFNGKFVNMAALNESCPLELFNEGKWETQMELLIDEVRNDLFNQTARGAISSIEV